MHEVWYIKKNLKGHCLKSAQTKEKRIKILSLFTFD